MLQRHGLASGAVDVEEAVETGGIYGKPERSRLDEGLCPFGNTANHHGQHICIFLIGGSLMIRR